MIEQSPELTQMIKITDDSNLITDGPLALQYTKALNEVYKKELDPVTGISLETQAIDAFVSKSLWVSSQNRRDKMYQDGQNVGLLYGVNKQEVGVSDVIEITDSVSGMNDTEKENSAIILDGSVDTNANGELVETQDTFVTAIEQFALENNINVYYSLEEFVESTKLKNGTYEGTISGNKVKFKIDKKTHTFTNSEGVRGKNIPCQVVVKKNDVYQINITK